MTSNTKESLDQVRARIAQAEADKQAEIDKTLEAFDRQVAERHAKLSAEQKAAQQQRDAAEKAAEKAAADAKFEREHMAPARRAWLAAGGTLEEFEAAKPQLRKEKLAELALGEKKVQNQWRRTAMSRYR